MVLGRYKVTASRWPWQGGGSWAPLNANQARFGGGWRWVFGVQIGASTVLLNLGWGTVRISKERP